MNEPPEPPRKGVIYLIRNTINGNIYVGQTVNPEKRWKTHLSRAKNGAKWTEYLYNAMRVYGVDNFEHSILEILNEDGLDEAEIFWIAYFKSIGAKMYNMNAGGNGQRGAKGWKWSADSKSKFASIKTGEQNPMFGKIALNSTLTAEQRNEVIELIKSGAIRKEVAKQFGVNRSVIDYLIRKKK